MLSQINAGHSHFITPIRGTGIFCLFASVIKVRANQCAAISAKEILKRSSGNVNSECIMVGIAKFVRYPKIKAIFEINGQKIRIAAAAKPGVIEYLDKKIESGVGQLMDFLPKVSRGANVGNLKRITLLDRDLSTITATANENTPQWIHSSKIRPLFINQGQKIRVGGDAKKKVLAFLDQQAEEGVRELINMIPKKSRGAQKGELRRITILPKDLERKDTGGDAEDEEEEAAEEIEAEEEEEEEEDEEEEEEEEEPEEEESGEQDHSKDKFVPPLEPPIPPDQLQARLERLRNIVAVSSGSLPIDRIVKTLKMENDDDLLDFIGEFHLQGIKIDWSQRVLNFQQEDLSQEIDALLKTYSDWNGDKSSKSE